MKTRSIAWQCLRHPSQRPLREVDHLAVSLAPRDRALVRAIVAAEVRRRATLHAIVRRFARGTTEPDVEAFLHIGLVQLYMLDHVPDHAAVGETVEAAARRLGSKRAGYVNAVLRKAASIRQTGHTGDPRRDIPERDVSFTEPIFTDPVRDPARFGEDAFNVPAFALVRWIARHGRERALEIARVALQESDLSLRVTARGAESSPATNARDAFSDLLRGAGCTPRNGAHPHVILLPSADSEAVLASAAFRDGGLTVQGETALRAAELLAARPGERVLDLCAAPGGKTAVLAETGASVVATDKNTERLARVHETAARLRLGERIEVVPLETVARDTRGFDAVLVDVPCSNSGVLAQRPEARWRLSSDNLASLARVQAELAEAAAAHVRPGGRLVYSTCSLEAEENRERVVAFLAAHADFTLDAEIEALPDPRGIAGPVDGGYAARLVRR
ncbi:MAG: RsmB/NOP family class I SAM-dependent RNA methyltransferase [Planctomycetota bacterium]